MESIPNVLHAFLIAPLVVLVILVLHVILVLLGPCAPASFSNTAVRSIFRQIVRYVIIAKVRVRYVGMCYKYAY